MCSASNALDFILFADDTNIFFSHKNIDYLEKTVNEKLSKLNNWCVANKVSINFKKSNCYIYFSNQGRKGKNLISISTLISVLLSGSKILRF